MFPSSALLSIALRTGPCQEFVDCVKSHLRVCRALGVNRRGKHHVMIEMACRLYWVGQPCFAVGAEAGRVVAFQFTPRPLARCEQNR
eukprot:15445412-Alexandrium_andersonii.AAC.2